MGQIRLQAVKSARTSRTYPDANYSTEQYASETTRGYLYVGFAALPDDLQRKKITSLQLWAYVVPWHDNDDISPPIGVAGVRVRENWGETTITANNSPNVGEWDMEYVIESLPDFRTTRTTSAGEPGYVYTKTLITDIETIRSILRYGVAVWVDPIYDVSELVLYKARAKIGTSRLTSGEPHVYLTYDDEDVTLTLGACSPSGGYVPKYRATTFRWSCRQTGEAYDPTPVTLTGSVFRWRETDSETVHEIDCGTDLSCTVPGGTFTADGIQWQAEITDSAGSTSISEWMPLTTAEVLSTAEPLSPVGEIVDGSARTLFTWRHVIATGTPQTAADVWLSKDNGTTFLKHHIDGQATGSYLSPDGLSSGEWTWWVRTYNTDGNPGSWSSGAVFTCVMAPSAPAVSAEQTPRPLISWQSVEQQGWQLRVAGIYDSGEHYGAEQSYRLPVTLEDGDYTVEVRVINEYGLWSDWGAAPITAANTPGAEITLTGYGYDIAALSWDGDQSFVAYQIERDGERIAITVKTDWSDITAAGVHTYRVRGLLDNGYYSLSNAVEIAVLLRGPVLIDAETKERVSLRYSATQSQDVQVNESAESTELRFAGDVYPSYEVSSYRARTLRLDTAYRIGNDAALRALLGRIVCLKTPDGSYAVGPLRTLQAVRGRYIVNYTLEVPHTAWKPEEEELP